MSPERNGDFTSPESQLYSRLPHLIDRSINASVRPDKARQAQRELLREIDKHPYFDPVLVAFHRLQLTLLEATHPRTIQNGISFMTTMMEGARESVDKSGSKILRVTPEILGVARSMRVTDQALKTASYYSKFPGNYHKTLSFSEGIESAHLRGENAIHVVFTDPYESEIERVKKRRALKKYNDWLQEVRGTDARLSEELSAAQRDKLVELLKIEPATEALGDQPLYDRKFGNISLKDVASWEYPPSDDELDRINEYLVGFLSAEPTMTMRNYRVIIPSLFFLPTFFYDENGLQIPKNMNLLGGLNEWQQRFAYEIATTGDEKSIARVNAVLRAVDEKMAALIIGMVLLWTSNPLEANPEFSNQKSELIPHHPLLDAALRDYTQNKSVEQEITYADEIGRDYFRKVILPDIKQRLKDLGVLEKFMPGILAIETELENRSFGEIHKEAIKEYFEKNCGQEFLEKFTKASDQIEEISQRVWSDIFQEGMHFLPMESGENIIEFSQGSLPEIVGLSSISFRTLGTPQDWKIGLRFRLRPGFVIELGGMLSSEGSLEFRFPLKREIPGLYSILRHIAILSFHDLVVQQRLDQGKATSNGSYRTKSGNSSIGTIDFNGGVIRSESGRLPRVQSERELTDSVFKKTQRKPRRVELQKRALPGSKTYEAALKLYEEALENNLPQETLEWIKEELNLARKKTYKISSKKKGSIPARFSLKTISDPLTGEERFLETWVVEHTSPKPSDEELRSPVLMFERNYRGSSALASLEQMKPWFIGE